jgi:hypothetical protein
MSGSSNGAAAAARVQVLNLLPMTNKRKKNHVPTTNRIRVACIPCRLDKQKCDAPRPCSRCLARNKVHLCIDRAADSILSADDSIVSNATSGSQDADTVMAEIQNLKKTSGPQDVSVLAEIEESAKVLKKRRRNNASEDGSSTSETSAKKPKKAKTKKSVDSNSDAQVKSEEHLPPGADVFKRMFSMLLKPVYLSIAERKSPFFIQDLIRRETRLWKGFVSMLASLIPMHEVTALQQMMIKSAASATSSEQTAQQMIETFSKVQPFNVINPSLSMAEKFDLCDETFSAIQDIFEIRQIENTDLAVVISKHIIVDDDTVSVQIHYNANLERLFGRTVESFGKGLDPSDGTPKTPFWLRVLTNKSLENVSSFLLSWVIGERTYFAETVEVIQPDGSIIRVYLAIIGIYEYVDGDPVSSANVFIFKPCSLTFDPDKYPNQKIVPKNLVNS